MSHVSHSVPDNHIRISDIGEAAKSAIDEITRVDAQVPYPTDLPSGGSLESREGSHIQTSTWWCMLHPRARNSKPY